MRRGTAAFLALLAGASAAASASAQTSPADVTVIAKLDSRKDARGAFFSFRQATGTMEVVNLTRRTSRITFDFEPS